MSLFKLKNLWAQSFPHEEFDYNHMCLGTIDTSCALALASFSGIMRVFTIRPNSPLNVSLVYEQKFQSPIIACQFVKHPEMGERNTIGILLFKKLVYLNLRNNGQKGGYQSKLISVNVEPGFALCGESMSILTLNSSVQYLNPLEVEKIKVSDSIYAYCRTQNSLYYSDGQELVFFKNSVEQWRVILGPMRQIQIFEQTIVVFGDFALWEVQDAIIKQTKVFDEELSCGALIIKEDSFNIMIGNFQSQLFIYDRYYTLMWAVKMEEIPLRVSIFQSNFLKGVLCILGDGGTVSISFLGSDLPESQIESLKDEIEGEDLDREIKSLLEDIETKNKEEVPQNQQKVVAEQETIQVTLKAKHPRCFESAMETDRLLVKNNKPWCCELECIVTPEKQPIFNVKLQLSLPSNLVCRVGEQNFSSIRSRQIILFSIFCNSEKFPYENEVSLTIRFQNTDKKKGISVINRKVRLPLDFQASLKSLQLQEKPNNKFVMKAKSQLPSFAKVFPEFQSQIKNSKNITVELSNQICCSLGYNKNSTKIKIESNFFSGLCYMYIVYWERLSQYLNKTGDKNKVDADVPLEQFFGIIKDHHQQRRQVKKKFEEVEKKSEQFRSIQKKLLLKMKENVTTVNQIDKLLEEMYVILMKAADSYEQRRQQLEVSSHNLEVCIKFITNVMFMKSEASEMCQQKVMGIMGYQRQNQSFGWEEKVVSSSSHYIGKKFNYETDSYTSEQVCKIVQWVISKINENQWN